jgi:hypothetical protein
MLYVANVGEDEIATGNKYVEMVKEYAAHDNAKVVMISAKIEEELSDLDDEDRQMFLEDLGVTSSGLDKLVKEAYDLLGLETFFPAGEKECCAWTYKKGMKAPQCAGIIHTDFERGFIKAETMSYDDFMKYGSQQATEWARFEALRDVDNTLGIYSSFWGMFQIGGFNWKLCGAKDVDEFFMLITELENRAVAKIHYAFELTDEQKEKLVKKLKSITNKEIDTIYIEDKDLIGGIKIELDGKVLDGSLSNRLNNIKGVIGK